MLVQTNQEFKGSAAGIEAMRQIVAKVGPIKTSQVFSPSGKRLMDGLVKYGYADDLGDGDYLIHFRQKPKK